MRNRLLSTCTFSLLLILLFLPAWAMQYEAVTLDLLPGSTYARALGINDQGQIVGTCRVGYQSRAVMWDRTGAISVIASVSDARSSGAGRINNQGHILIGIDPQTGLSTSILATVDSVIRTYPVAAAGEVGMLSLNDRDQMVGYENNRDPYINMGVFWDGDSVVDMTHGSVPDVLGAVPLDLNNNGWAVGYYNDYKNYDRSQACLWRSPSQMEYLLSEETDFSEAVAINDAGQVVGGCDLPDGGGGWFLWQNGAHRFLNLPSNKNMLTANDINNSAQIVGRFGFFTDEAPAPTETCDAFVWQDDVFCSLPSPYLYSEALAVNNNGWVVGWACNSISNSYTDITHPMLWVPVPEPSSLLSVIAGAMGLALTARSKRLRDSLEDEQ